MMEAAIRFTSNGIRVFICNPDKTPATRNGFKAASLHAEDFEWKGKLIGMPCGEICVWDIDDKNWDGDNLDAEFQLRCKEYGVDLSKFPKQKTPSGNGTHYFFRPPIEVRNGPLARSKDGRVILETRGQGGYVCVAPSAGYSMVGDLEIWEAPHITKDELDAVNSICRSFDEQDVPTKSQPLHETEFHGRPGDDFNTKADWYSLLRKHDWHPINASAEEWRRPGKSHGVSATLNRVPDRFYVFTSSTNLEPMRAYSKFQLYAFLEHGGDFSAASRQLASKGYGEQHDPHQPGADISSLIKSIENKEEEEERLFEDCFTVDDEKLQLPDEVISGVVFRGGKILFSGASKSRKTFAMLDLAVSVANGARWLGMQTKKGNVLNVDLELMRADFHKRLGRIARARKLTKQGIHCLLLRGKKVSLPLIKKIIIDKAKEINASLITIDPYYRISSGAEENSNSDIAELLLNFEEIAHHANSAIAITHHFAKGNSGAKNSIDRASGAGAFARDPDCLISMTEHGSSTAENPAMVIEMNLRSFAPVEPFSIRWEYPIWTRDDSLQANVKGGSEESTVGIPDLLECFVRPKQHITTGDLKSAMIRNHGITSKAFYALLKKAKEDKILKYKKEGKEHHNYIASEHENQPEETYRKPFYETD